VKHGWLSGFSLAQVTATVLLGRYASRRGAAADAVPTQTVGPGPCGPVAAGCYGASAAELELEGVPLVLSGCRPLTGTVTRTAARRASATHWQPERQPPETFADVEAQLQVELEV
jgi:hypothetical protein